VILVDTSVWIGFLEGGAHWTNERLKDRIQDRHSLLYTEMILLELLQGIRSRKERKEIETKFSSLVLVPQRRSTTLLAADIYQELRKKGITIRSIVDCLIAASSIETGASILHKDRDFDRIAEFYPVRLENE
jgi:predicted nucleic acid-binding protein